MFVLLGSLKPMALFYRVVREKASRVKKFAKF